MKKLTEEIKRMRNSSLAGNASWLFCGQGASMVCQALYFMLIARLLHSAEYGIYVGVLATVTIASQYSPLGSHSVMLRYVSADTALFSKYWGNVVYTTLGLGSALVIFFVCLGPHIASSYPRSLLFYVAASECLFVQLVLAAARVFQVFEKMRFTALLNLATSALRAILAGVLLWRLHHGTALDWAIASFAISALACVVSLILVTRFYGLPCFAPVLLKERAREGFVFALSYSTTGVYNDIDKAMLGHYGMNAANGIYTLAYRIVDSGSTPVISIQAAAFPRIFREGVKGIKKTAGFSYQIIKRTGPVSLVCALFIFVIAPAAPLFCGKAFTETANALRWLCILPFFRSFQLSGGDALTGAGHQSLRLAAQAVAAALNFTLNLYLIPRYSWHGAAWSSIATDGMLGLANWMAIFWLLRASRKALEAVELSST